VKEEAMAGFRVDRAKVAEAVGWAIGTTCGERVVDSAMVVFRLVNGRMLVGARCGVQQAGTQIAARLAFGEVWMNALELAGPLAELSHQEGELVVAGGGETVTLSAGESTRTVRRLNSPDPDGDQSSTALAGVKTTELGDAVDRVRGLTGSGILHVEVSAQRLLVVGAHGRGRAYVPVEVVSSVMTGVERFSFLGPELATALSGLRDEVALLSLLLSGERRERGGLVRVSLADADSIAVLPSTSDRFPDYRSLLQGSPSWVMVEPLPLHRTVVQAGAIGRADGEVSPVVELRARGHDVVVLPVVDGVARELDAKSVGAVVFAPVRKRMRYRVEDLATALLAFDGGSVGIRVSLPHGDATIIEHDGELSDPDVARWSVPGVA
jgi:hypothetical protein